MTSTSGRVTTTMTIGGMLSVHAARAVFTALGGVPGVTSAEVGLGKAVVQHDGSASAELLQEAIELAGCEVLQLEESRRQLPMHHDDREPGIR